MTMDPNLYPRGTVRREVVQEEVPAVEPVVPAAVEEERVAASAGGIERRQRLVRDATGAEHGEAYVRDAETEQRYWLYMLSQAVWLLLALVEILIGLRVLLKAIGANPDAGFAHFVYGAGGFFAWPFLGLTASPASGNMIIEIPSIIAMIVYAIIAWAVVQLIWLFYRPHTRAASTYDRFRL